jgi:ribonuclease HII
MSDKLVAGIDEVARGCLAGPVYSAAVIWPNDFDENEEKIELRDSKKLSRKRRDYLKDYIEEMAIDFSVASVTNEIVDDINILNATFKSMHKAIDNLNVVPDELLVDDKMFEPYFTNENELIPHKCVIGGDDKFQNISAASILAKVYHDNYIDELVEDNPELKVYNWQSNMCYGTAEHLNAIREHGISKYHRKTFGICKEY